MKRTRIEEILQQELNVKEDKGWTHYQAPEPDEVIELCRLALRATDPEYVRVPIADIIDVGKEPFKDGACEQCYPHQEYTKPGFRCVYHEAADKYRAHFQENQQ